MLDRDGEVLSQVENGQRVYTGDSTQRKAVLHAVGDPQGKIGTGALTAFADLLTGYNPITGVAAAAQGGGDVYLTIDVDCQIAAWRALNGRKGAVAVYNYETGQVVCMVSSPSYDPENIPADLETSDAYQGAYLNRVLSAAFTPGSIFKTVTLTAAIETIPDLFDRTWTCTGSTEIGGDSVTCPSAHGEMDIGDAFASSWSWGRTPWPNTPGRRGSPAPTPSAASPPGPRTFPSRTSPKTSWPGQGWASTTTPSTLSL